MYFVGAGGIGMSALIRYFLAKGKRVGGYDKTPSDLTEELKKEGADIHYEDNVALIGERSSRPMIRWWFIRRRSRSRIRN